jgi:hypothetical protein
VYDVDGVAERLGADLVGFDERSSSINAMRAADAVYFMKTHRQRDSQVDESDPAICLVRDGRDGMVSYAHLTSEGDATQFAPMLRSLICRHDEVGTGNWGRNILSWLLPPADHRLVLRYEDLVCDPEGAVNHLMAKLLPQLTPLDRAQIPSFAQLQTVDDRSFRAGASGSHLIDLPEELCQLFWTQPENREAMQLLNYT